MEPFVDPMRSTCPISIFLIRFGNDAKIWICSGDVQRYSFFTVEKLMKDMSFYTVLKIPI